MDEQARIAELFRTLGVDVSLAEAQGLPVASPWDGEMLATLTPDNHTTLGSKINKAKAAQLKFAGLSRQERAGRLEIFSAALKSQRAALAEILHIEAGKTLKEAQGEIDGSADVLIKTIKDATLAEQGNMLRTKERPPVGIVGLITSFNFPAVVAHWTIAPALLAGNAVVWKPSEKTPLVAIAIKAVFDKALPAEHDLLQLIIGGREVGAALVEHEDVGMISATGSEAMGRAISTALSRKGDKNIAPPVLELGGNNGIIISDKISPTHLEWSIKAIMGSYLGTGGQRCTNTRRLIIHRSVYDKAVSLLEGRIEQFLSSVMKNGQVDPDNEFGYGPLIDGQAYMGFEQAKQKVAEEGGAVLFGKRLFSDAWPEAYYVEPALALLQSQQPVMYEETFAPILFIVPYDTFDEALHLLNAPANAGLVSGIYTQSKSEAEAFAARTQAGHAVINSPKGTGTPAHGMGFGGNKASGEGEILNAADPLAAFTRRGNFRRIAENRDITYTFG